MVKFYKTPGYSTWDPSVVVFLSFALFFAMIISDAGYGLVLGLILLATWNRLSGGGLRGLLVVLVIATILYGMLVGTYFGVTPPPRSWLSILHVIDAHDQRLMMLIAIGIGVAHVGGIDVDDHDQHVVVLEQVGHPREIGDDPGEIKWIGTQAGEHADIAVRRRCSFLVIHGQRQLAAVGQPANAVLQRFSGGVALQDIELKGETYFLIRGLKLRGFADPGNGDAAKDNRVVEVAEYVRR